MYTSRGSAQNTIIGSFAGYSATTGTGAVGVGYKAGYANQGQGQWVAIGYEAMGGTPGTNEAAVSEIEALIDFYERQADNAEADLVTIGTSKERNEAEVAIIQSRNIISAYKALIVGIQQTGKKPDPSIFDDRK